MSPRSRLGKRISKIMLDDMIIDIRHKPKQKWKRPNHGTSQFGEPSKPSSILNSPAPDILCLNNDKQSPLEDEAATTPSLHDIFIEPNSLSPFSNDCSDFDFINYECNEDFEGNICFFESDSDFINYEYNSKSDFINYECNEEHEGNICFFESNSDSDFINYECNDDHEGNICFFESSSNSDFDDFFHGDG